MAPADDGIGREFRQMRTDFKDSFGRIEAQLAKLLPRELYDAHRVDLMRRVETLERDMESAEKQRGADREADKARREDEKKEADRVKVNFRRWIIGAVSIPLFTTAVIVFLTVVKP